MTLYTKAILVKPWLPGVEGAIVGETGFTCVYIGKYFYPLAQVVVKGIKHHFVYVSLCL
jgi:hypothetical protein